MRRRIKEGRLRPQVTFEIVSIDREVIHRVVLKRSDLARK
jgi:hypothetical protein